MKTLKIVAITILLSACDKGTIVYEKHCQSHNKEMSDWVSQCIKDANPMSDEEPEDMIEQCEKTANNLFCSEEKFYKDARTNHLSRCNREDLPTEVAAMCEGVNNE